MTRSKSTAKGEFAGKYSSCNDASQSSGVLARGDGMSTSYAKHIEHSRLWFQNGAAAQCADFNGRHRDRDLEGAAETICTLDELNIRQRTNVYSLFHDRNAVRTLHNLRRILACSDENSCHKVRSVCIEAANTGRHSGTNQVLVDIQFNQ